MDKLESKTHNAVYATFVIKNQLLKTTRLFQDRDNFSPRCVYEHSEGNIPKVAEGEDTTSTPNHKFITFAPQRHDIQHFLSDKQPKTVSGNPVLDVSNQLAYAFAHKLDSDITETFKKFTGGTVGATGKKLTWGRISRASANLSINKAHGHEFCVLHPYQWVDLIATASDAGHIITRRANNYIWEHGMYFESTLMPNTTFFVTPAIVIDVNGDATGAMYASNAIGVDIRQEFTVKAQRDANRQATEINASMVYDVGILNPLFGIKIISDVTDPEQD